MVLSLSSCLFLPSPLGRCNFRPNIGTAAAREVIRSYEFGASNKKLKMNILLTTYELTLRDAKDLGEVKRQALAVDEVRYGTILVFSLLTGLL